MNLVIRKHVWLLQFALLVVTCLSVSGGKSLEDICVGLPCNCYKDSGRRIIDCSNKGLPSIPNFLSLSGHSFHSVLLNDNRITVLPRNTFKDLDVRLINLSNNPLSSLSDKAISQRHAVEELYLKNCTLNLAPYSLEKLHNLKKLDMSWNDISSLPERAFKNMNRLEYLNLSHNRRIQFPDPFASFDNLTNLQYLDLSFCGLYNLPIGTSIKHVAKLKSVLLQNNSIGSIPDNVLHKCPRLEVLDLDNNPLSLASDNVFRDLPKLRVLKLGSCDIPSIKKSMFQSYQMQQLETLTFHHCAMEKIDNGFFRDFTRLQVLDIGGNPSIAVTQDLLSGLEYRLTNLGISDMNIRHFPKDIIAEFSQLRVVNASGNRIKELREADFGCIYHSHAAIYLDNNKISRISSRVSHGLRRPFTLSLKNNNLTSLQFLWEYPCLFARSVVDVSNNPIHCDCALYSLVQQKNIKLEGSCQTPNQYRGITLVPPYGDSSKSLSYSEAFLDKICRKNGDERFEQRFDCGCKKWKKLSSKPCRLSNATRDYIATPVLILLLVASFVL